MGVVKGGEVYSYMYIHSTDTSTGRKEEPSLQSAPSTLLFITTKSHYINNHRTAAGFA